MGRSVAGGTRRAAAAPPAAPGWPGWTDPAPVARLHEAVRTRPSHAYLVSGPSGVGKAAIVRGFAKALCCLEPAPDDPADPCGRCRSCRAIDRGGHPDVTEFSIASQAALADKPTRATTLNIETVRQLRTAAMLLPAEGNHRVLIVEDAETMLEPAQQAMLKILEEPPAAVTLVLIADEPDALLPTVRSRCQEISVRPMAESAIEQILLARDVDPIIAAEIAVLSMGRPGWALAAAVDSSLLRTRRDEWREALGWITAPPYQRLVTAFKLGEQFSKRPGVVTGALAASAAIFRQAMLVAAGAKRLESTDQHPMIPTGIAATPRDFGRAIDATLRCLADLDANVRPRLALEAMVLAWPNLESA